ncbi:nSTAND1 domain-containing NTPase [Acidithiobacillus ferriphilus]|uniref:nSTAND1 domain-containing NTPase n=1 Tax=Acidithiobacillus ferriphilus TaxID=1689834 RepID=UPI004055D265
MSNQTVLDIEVEVTVKDGDSSTQRGVLLESLAKRVLVALQHDYVNTSVRVTGCELDIIATDRQTGARVVVECKAYRDRTISADVLTKMLGNLVVHDFQSAWLITTARLGKDASGIVSNMQAKSIDKRQILRVYEPKELVELLVSIGQIKDPNQLELSDALQTLPNRTLLITDIGEFWAVSAIGQKSGVADTVIVLEARSGQQVTNPALVQQLSERDSNLRELRWISGEGEFAAVGALADASLKQELDNIASVPVADDWSDYRPARPEDFVGRDDLLKNIIGFFDEITTHKTSTRLLAIKAPSGWGKSSFLIKLRATCTLPKFRERVFLYAVDCRTASSPRYPELALKRCLDEAIKDGFISGDENACRVASAGRPFSDSSVQAILQQLREQNKVIVLFFDQFEEITTKQELSDLFIQIKMLCAAIESASENIVLGFSWKTDGSIPTDHPAYHVWHSFSDRRREFELPLFSRRDTSQLLTRLSKELKQPIEPGLRRLLSEHCQGYPWLLKKLCVHVFRVLQTQPARQRELLERALDVEALFRKDLADIDSVQIACLEKIAKDSPADHFKIAEQFGDPTIDALMQRRLVIRNAGKLVLYWDIFRDFVLSKQIPAIPTRYMPVSPPATAKRILESLSTTGQLSTLATKLGLENGTLDNVARDLVMMGVCQYDRKKKRLSLVHTSQRETLLAASRFFASHALLRKLVDQFGRGFRGVSLATVERTLACEFASQDYTKKTVHALTIRLIAWLQAFGIVSVDGANYMSHEVNQPLPLDFSKLRIGLRRSRGNKLFMGEAPPSRVLEVLTRLQAVGYSPKPTDRNPLYVLLSLRLISSTVKPLLIEKPPKGAETAWLASKVVAQHSVRVARDLIRNDQYVGALEIGEALESLAHRGVSEASKRRYGSGVLVWVNWLHDLTTGESISPL